VIKQGGLHRDQIKSSTFPSSVHIARFHIDIIAHKGVKGPQKLLLKKRGGL